MEMLSYKGYEGTTEIDMQRDCCFGRLLFVADLVTYEARTPAELRKEFEAAVDDYLETCATVGKLPVKPCSGVFQVRVTPQLHRDAVLRAIRDGVALNAVVSQALSRHIYGTTDTTRAQYAHRVAEDS
ncbi:MAG: type II toxin-antitoxin system HicB family antitoxin [Arenimonas sp.]